MRTALHTRGSILITLPVAALIWLAFTGHASASSFCVGDPACPAGPSNNYATIQGALTAAGIVSGTDRIEISPGTYADGPWVTGALNPVEIVGVGATKPVLSAPAVIGTKVLTLNADGSSIQNVAITVPAADGATGLEVDKWATVSNVAVTGPGSANAVGIALAGHNSSVVTDVDVNLDWGGGNQSNAITLATASSATIYDSTLRACTGLSVYTSNNVDVERLRVTADNGVFFLNSSGTVSSSLLRYSTPALMGYHYGLRVNNTDGSLQTVNSVNNTIVGGVATGIVSSASTPGVNTVNVNSNVIAGFSASFLLDGTGTNTVSTTYSRYDVTPPQPVGAGNALFSGDPGFVNAGGGDYLPRRDSALVDAGDPNAVATGGQPIPSARDLAGNNRQVNAVGTDAATRDIGAFEVQNGAPTAVINVLTPNPSTSSPVNFSSDGSSEPDGDLVSYLWSFDDGVTISGLTAQRSWDVTGIQTVRLTVTDSTGLSATAAVQIRVAKGSVTMSLPRGSAKVDAHGSFKYKLTCPSGAEIQCSGRVLFMTAAKIDLKRFSTTSAKRKVKAAQLVYTMKTGQTKSFNVRTYRTFQKVMKRERSVALMATLTGTAANVDLKAAPTKFTVKRGKK